MGSGSWLKRHSERWPIGHYQGRLVDPNGHWNSGADYHDVESDHLYAHVMEDGGKNAWDDVDYIVFLKMRLNNEFLVGIPTITAINLVVRNMIQVVCLQ